MSNDTAPDTPPKQKQDDPIAADRRLSEQQKDSAKNESAPPNADSGGKLPDPRDVGEAG